MQVQVLPTGPMPMHSDALLFSGTTAAPARDFVAEQLADRSRIVLPCVGRWAVATAVAARHGAQHIEASDLSLFSSIIGYLADPTHELDELGIVVPERYEPLVAGAPDQYAWAAGVLLAMKFSTLASKHVHQGQVRRELWSRRTEYRAKVAQGLQEQVDLMRGCSYEVADVREVAESLIGVDQSVGCFMNLPGYRGIYTAMYGAAEAEMWPGTQLAAAELDPSESPALLAPLTGTEAQVIAYLHPDDVCPLGWAKLAAIGGKHGRNDYVVTNHDTGARLTKGQFDKPHDRWPVFSDSDEITAQSVVSFTFTDRWTCLHYRDLFVHRLGFTESEKYGLMLIDGKVVTAFGLHAQSLHVGATPYLRETFGITMTSNRYARLGKLFMLMLTSRDFHAWLTGQSHDFQTCDPQGISTSSPTQRHEGKTDRSVMKMVSRVPQAGGGFQLVYEAPWRDETWDEALARWLVKWGGVSRPGFVAA